MYMHTHTHTQLGRLSSPVHSWALDHRVWMVGWMQGNSAETWGQKPGGHLRGFNSAEPWESGRKHTNIHTRAYIYAFLHVHWNANNGTVYTSRHIHTHTHMHMYSCGSNRLLEPGTGGNSQGGDSENTHYTSAFIYTMGLRAYIPAVKHTSGGIIASPPLRYTSDFIGKPLTYTVRHWLEFLKPPVAQEEFCKTQILKERQTDIDHWPSSNRRIKLKLAKCCKRMTIAIWNNVSNIPPEVGNSNHGERNSNISSNVEH